MLGRIVSHEEEGALLALLPTASKKGTDDCTHWAAIDKAQERLVIAGQVQAITGNSMAIEIVCGSLLLHQTSSTKP